MEGATRAAWEEHLQNTHSGGHLASKAASQSSPAPAGKTHPDRLGKRSRAMLSLSPSSEEERFDTNVKRCQKSRKTCMASGGIGSSVISFKREFTNQI